MQRAFNVWMALGTLYFAVYVYGEGRFHHTQNLHPEAEVRQEALEQGKGMLSRSHFPLLHLASDTTVQRLAGLKTDKTNLLLTRQGNPQGTINAMFSLESWISLTFCVLELLTGAKI